MMTDLIRDSSCCVRALAWATALAATLGSAALTGCDTVKAPYAPGGDQVPASNYPKVAFYDKELSGMLVVDPNIVVVDRPEGRPMKVTVPLRSVSDHAMKLQYQFLWRDSLGRPVGESGWRYTRVEPRVQVPFQANALTQDAVDWRLEVRFER
ncbi:MAG: DUF1425 domain-containing protein [Phycisphaeraceae bacterium]|nr:DUF1425 domain-containing protein [Phycisphaerae bacterium]MBX3392358.1 DUF1425 domain-containing protein [Phycisphaeraceae bacterium]